jgi:hypothetical protein
VVAQSGIAAASCQFRPDHGQPSGPRWPYCSAISASRITEQTTAAERTIKHLEEARFGHCGEQRRLLNMEVVFGTALQPARCRAAEVGLLGLTGRALANEEQELRAGPDHPV